VDQFFRQGHVVLGKDMPSRARPWDSVLIKE
jgi:hypothetical protein